jgi:hypothetical protein
LGSDKYALLFAVITVIHVPIYGVAFLLVQFGRVDARQFVEDGLVLHYAPQLGGLKRSSSAKPILIPEPSVVRIDSFGIRRDVAWFRRFFRENPSAIKSPFLLIPESQTPNEPTSVPKRQELPKLISNSSSSQPIAETLPLIAVCSGRVGGNIIRPGAEGLHLSATELSPLFFVLES